MSSRFAKLVNAQFKKEQPPPSRENGQRQESSLPPQSSQLPESSQPSEQPRGGHESSQLSQSRQPQESPQHIPPESPQSSQLSQSSQNKESRLNLLASLPEAKGHMETPFQLLDHLFRHLDPFEQAAYLQLCRLSWGWRQNRCRVSNPKLAERANMSLSQVKKVIGKLINKGLIEKTGNVQGYGKDQGVEYIVHAPSWQVLRSSQPQQGRQPRESSQPPQSTNKDKEKDITKGDFTSCPDCLGTGFYYPQGTDKGVARCMHKQMQK
jgi:DNA mismatch repair ATPase MutL